MFFCSIRLGFHHTSPCRGDADQFILMHPLWADKSSSLEPPTVPWNFRPSALAATLQLCLEGIVGYIHDRHDWPGLGITYTCIALHSSTIAFSIKTESKPHIFKKCIMKIVALYLKEGLLIISKCIPNLNLVLVEKGLYYSILPYPVVRNVVDVSLRLLHLLDGLDNWYMRSLTIHFL